MKKAIILLTIIFVAINMFSDDRLLEQQLIENKERQASPVLEKIVTYNISPDDTTGFVSSKEFFDTVGNMIKFESYDYYGSGNIDSTTNYKYDNNGKKIQMDDGSTITTYEYNDQELLINETWKRGSSGNIAKNTYDDHGNLVETKYFKLDGNYDFSRVYQQVYDLQGNTIEEWKWEKYSDGYPDREMYHIKKTYNDQSLLIEKINLNPSGDYTDKEQHRYDHAGNIIETIEYENDPAIPVQRTLNKYNEYGELIIAESFNCDKTGALGQRWSVTEFRYNQYGQEIKNMLLQEHGENYGERKIYFYMH